MNQNSNKENTEEIPVDLKNQKIINLQDNFENKGCSVNLKVENEELKISPSQNKETINLNKGVKRSTSEKEQNLMLKQQLKANQNDEYIKKLLI